MNIYSKRREKLLKNFKDNALIILFSGNAPMRSEDEAYPFCVNRNFYYLTGLEKENMALLIYKIDDVIRESLYILPFDDTLARWVGGRMSAEEAREISEVATVNDYSELDGAINSVMNFARSDCSFRIYLDLWKYNPEQAPSPALVCARKLQQDYPAATIKDLYPYMAKMRLYKDEYELTCISQAIAKTRIGIENMMKTSKPGLNEMVMEGVFDFSLMRNGCNESAFKTICASGERATILHYSDNDQIMNDGELFLCDLGGTFKHYCADISRTFPVNGVFSPRQREIYEIVLNAQRIVVENAKVGVSLKELNRMVVDYYKAELPKHGLLEDVSEYYFHGVSHHLGLDVHDVDGSKGRKLEAGMVITNEPGLYIASEGIGIRIEDDLLITGTGAVNLSMDIIKEPDDIEALMKQN